MGVYVCVFVREWVGVCMCVHTSMCESASCVFLCVSASVHLCVSEIGGGGVTVLF